MFPDCTQETIRDFNSTLDEDKAEKSEQIGATRNSVSFGERKGLIGRQEERY